MREILHLQVGQGGNHVGAKVSYLLYSVTCIQFSSQINAADRQTGQRIQH